MRRLVFFILTITLMIFAIVSFSRLSRNSSTIRFRVMGTEAVITVNDKGAPEHIRSAVKTIQGVAKLLDIWDAKSEVSLINRSAGIKSVRVKNDTFGAIEQALFLSRLTKGAFDITLSDYKKVRADAVDRTVFLKEAGIKIDLGGIGKGYAVEKARQALLSRSVKSALIDMHSSMAAIGGPWKIGIQDPRSKGKIIDTIILNHGDALSTSGNYEQGPHLVDPRLGKKVNTCHSVTVIAKDAGFADGLSTALFVMGPAKALDFVRPLKEVKVLIVTLDGKVLKSW